MASISHAYGGCFGTYQSYTVPQRPAACLTPLQDGIDIGAQSHLLARPIMTATTLPRDQSSGVILGQKHANGNLNRQPTFPLPLEKVYVFHHLQDWAEANILPLLKPVETSWQPQDFLPDASSESYEDDVHELRRRSSELPDDYLVCLIGDMITEEALPTYQTWLNTMEGIIDVTGCSPTPWARWNRGWSAEENRHGDLLNKYLFLTGRVDMRSIEKTVHYLIQSGMNIQTESNAYLGMIYTSFQERATFISHGNTARKAREYGDMKLAQICGTIAADEKRHENAYAKVVEKLFEVDPDYTMLCLEDMMKKKITMPAHLMFDGTDRNIYENFAQVAQRIGVYTAKDYADILEHLVKRWNIEKLKGLSSRGQQAQEYVCNLPCRVRKIEERAQAKGKKGPKMGSFSWIFNRQINLL